MKETITVDEYKKKKKMNLLDEAFLEFLITADEAKKRGIASYFVIADKERLYDHTWGIPKSAVVYVIAQGFIKYPKLQEQVMKVKAGLEKELKEKEVLCSDT